MKTITVGVPVYNGEAMIARCLANLAEQSFGDFEVLVYDNASTDRTAQIAKAFAANDKRFQYIMQPYNKGAVQNFMDVLDASQSKYFSWRAHDDLSSSDFLAQAVQALEANTHAELFVSRVEQVKADLSKRRLWPVKTITSGFEPLRLARGMLTSRASWFYGVWNRKALLREFYDMWQQFPSHWGSDHLTFLRPLVRNTVLYSNTTIFTQQLKSGSVGWKPRPSYQPPTAAQMWELRSQFRHACDALLENERLSPVQRMSLAILLPLYVGKRVCSARKMLKAHIREKWK
jgi:glycosyltransferase involved in cell wall biosynthesis